MARTLLTPVALILLLLVVPACGDDGGQAIDAAGADPDGAANVDATADADPNAPDADPNAPDADPNASDADPNAPDADPNAPDATPIPDADTTPDGSTGVTCGEETCGADQECCVTFEMGQQEQMCVETGTCEGGSFACDGPEDCPDADESCCGDFEGSTSCEPTDSCSIVVCSSESDCGENESCCESGFFPGGVCSQFCF